MCDADNKGVPLGLQVTAETFDECGRVLVLVEELMTSAKKLHAEDELPAGSFLKFIAFILVFSEATRVSKYSIVMVSIPESEREKGNKSGQRALEAFEHIFGRLEVLERALHHKDV